MTPPKLMLTIVAGGILLGALGGQLARPVMKSAEKPDWHGRSESQFSATPVQFADGRPEDLSPQGSFGPGYVSLVDYAPPSAAQYAVADALEPPPEVEQASADAAETAAALTEPPPATAPRADSTSAATSQAPQTREGVSADKTL